MLRVKQVKGGDLRTIKRKTKNTLKKVYKVVKKVAKIAPNVVGPIPNETVLNVLEGKRTAGVLPPSVRTLLDKIGNDPITSIKVVRTPISSFVSGFLNVISLGAFNKALKDNGYDKALHLSLKCNEYILDKQAVISLVKGDPIKKDSEVLTVPIGHSITFRQLLDNTRKEMGDTKFSNYNSKSNNCQNFVMSILKANGLLNEELSSFIKQDAEEIFKKLGWITEKIANVVTDTGALADKAIEGEGVKKKRNSTKWQNYLKTHMKGKTFKSKEESAKFIKKLSVSYKKLQSKK